MHRRTQGIHRGAGRRGAVRKALLSAAAVALATGCTAQAVGAAGSASPSAATASTAVSPSATAPSAAPSAAAGSPSAAAPSTAAPSEPTSASPSSSGGADAADGKPSGSAEGQPSGGAVLMKKGSETEQVRELQARLRQLGYFKRSPTAFYGTITSEAVSAFQEKRGLPVTGTVDATTWQRLVAMTRKPTADELRPATSNPLAKPDERCMTGRVLCISKESRTLAWMIDGKVVSAMDVRFGVEGTELATREGTFKVDRKERTWTSTLYHTSMPYSMFFSRGQAVHYSADFAAKGYNGNSHGCVNVRDKARLAKVFGEVRVGDKVVVYW
ncbi:L,D-transpeptidase family protein [Streptomyces sp. CC228A]|uniref:L,D-transpeptidase family protein n=1 Tax=Streptomyces sp. CC228A TaxID=2898186 RepID=UPI001F1B3219|nr:L,D-transpeptidase family protein [Streptomyces sp. CC228A]